MATKDSANTGFSKEEREAMKARAKELAAEGKSQKKREDGERDVLAAIAAMDGEDRRIAERIHSIVKEAAPALWPKTWYGMPAYAKDGKVVCFFKAAAKFESRYATFGFDDAARLDKGNMWATTFALVRLTAEEERSIAGLVREAVKG